MSDYPLRPTSIVLGHPPGVDRIELLSSRSYGPTTRRSLLTSGDRGRDPTRGAPPGRLRRRERTAAEAPLDRVLFGPQSTLASAREIF